jgi:ectoine hydroxylase-related dioxygenase (phytanoyl-CoA dioxygenase family)
MRLGDWETTKDLNPIYRAIREFDLEQNVAEHDAFGFTVVPAKKVAPAAFQRRLLEATLKLHARRTGDQIAVDTVDTTATITGKSPVAGHIAFIGEDRAFEEMLLNPVVLALARYFLGKSVLLSDVTALVKRTGPEVTHILHHDQSATPPPLPQYAQTLNVTWILTDYTKEKGALSIVPGSHRFGKMPERYEENFLAENALVPGYPVECEAGSLIIWGGTTWHGSFPRSAPGVRVTQIMTFCRPYMKSIHDYRDEIEKEVLDRNPPEFARLLGLRELFPLKAGIRNLTPEEELELGRKKKAYRDAGRNPWG